MARSELTSVAQALKDIGSVRYGDFVLTSGKRSSFYIDLRILKSHPQEKKTVVDTYIGMLAKAEYNIVADIPYAITPVVSSIADRLALPQVTPLKEAKTHGIARAIEGDYTPGQVVAVCEDLTTTGGSLIKGVETLRNGGLVVNDVFFLINRGGPAALQTLRDARVNPHYFADFVEMTHHYLELGAISPSEHERTMNELQAA